MTKDQKWLQYVLTVRIEERNKAIDECAKLAREYKEIIFLGENFAKKLESLKK